MSLDIKKIKFEAELKNQTLAVMINQEGGQLEMYIDHKFDLQEMQEYVGGRIEADPLSDKITLIFNEQGRLFYMNLPFNDCVDRVVAQFIPSNMKCAPFEIYGNAILLYNYAEW